MDKYADHHLNKMKEKGASPAAIDEKVKEMADHECHEILNGFGNTDQFITEANGVPFQGATFRLFNPKTRLWSLYWADSNTVVPDVP